MQRYTSFQNELEISLTYAGSMTEIAIFNAILRFFVLSGHPVCSLFPSLVLSFSCFFVCLMLVTLTCLFFVFNTVLAS